MKWLPWACLVAAIALEVLGSTISIVGLSAMAGPDLIVIVLAVVLDLSKLVVVSVMYTYWNRMLLPMKAFSIVATIIMMTFTSVSAFAYLASTFKNGVAEPQAIASEITVLEKEQAYARQRKEQIDRQIAELPSEYVSSRIRLQESFKGELAALDGTINSHTSRLTELRDKQSKLTGKASYVVSLSQVTGFSVETVIAVITTMIVVVFDPLAVFLVLMYNVVRKPRVPPPKPKSVRQPTVKQKPMVKQSPKKEEEHKPKVPDAVTVSEDLDTPGIQKRPLDIGRITDYKR